MSKVLSRGDLMPTQETMPGSPKLELEFVPHRNNAKALYLRLDGERIAYHNRAVWVSMKSGYRVENDATLDSITVYMPQH